MTVQLSVAVRNARLDAIETAAGVSPKLRLYSGAAPANCAAARTGTLACEIALPSDWAANASGGSKALAGSWAGAGAAAAGTGTAVAHFALMDNAGATCHMQGTVTVTGGGGDLTLDNVSIAQNQAVNVTSWTLTDANA
jgi:hypothetical protein